MDVRRLPSEGVAARRRQRGSMAVNAAVISVIALVATAGIVQIAMVGDAQTTVQYAALMGARSGAVHNASADEIAAGVAQGLAPLYATRAASVSALSTTELPMLPDSGGLPGNMGITPGGSSHGIDFGSIHSTTEGVYSPLEYANDVTRVSKRLGDANAAAAMAYSDYNSRWGFAVINPVVEAFDDFAITENGLTRIPNTGIWRRTGRPTGATTTVNVCEAQPRPYYEDPYGPPSFSSTPEADDVERIFRNLVWDSAEMADAFGEDCPLFRVACKNAYDDARSASNHFVDLADTLLWQPISAAIADYENGDISAGEMYDRIESIASDPDVIDTFQQEAADSGWSWFLERYQLLDRVTQVADTAAKMGELTGAGAGDNANIQAATLLGMLGSPDAKLRYEFDRNRDGGEDLGEYAINPRDNGRWEAFMTEYESLKSQYLDANPPEYKKFVDLASALADDYLAMGDWPAGQERYLNSLVSMSEMKVTVNEDYVTENVCTVRTVQSYSAPTVGSASNLNIQDANILRVYVLYGMPRVLDIPNALYSVMGWSRASMPAAADNVPEPLRGLYNSIIADGLMPVAGTAMVRMQSDIALASDVMVSKGDSFFKWENIGTP